MYYRSVVKIEADVISKYQDSILRLVTNAEYMLINMETDLLQLIDDEVFANYKKMSKPGENVDDLITLNKKLRDIKRKNSIIESVYFYDHNQNAVITNEYGGYKKEEFYDMNWYDYIIENDLQTQVIRLNTRLNVDQKIVSNEKEMRNYLVVPTYVITIVIKIDEGKYIVVNINQEKFYTVLNNMHLLDEELFIAVDNEGTILLNKDNDLILSKLQCDDQLLNLFESNNFFTLESNIDGRKHLLVALNSSYNNWNYILGIPLSSMLEDINYFKTFILILSFILIMVGCIFALIIATHLYSPFNDLIDSLKQSFTTNNSIIKTNDEIEFFRLTFNKAVEEKKFLQDTVAVYEKTVRNKYLIDYVKKISSKDQFISNMSKINCNYNEKYYKIIIMESKGYSGEEIQGNEKERLVKCLNLMEICDTLVNSKANGVFCSLEQNLFMVFINCSNTDQLNDVDVELNNLLTKFFKVGYIRGISNTYEELDYLTEAYEEAMKAVAYGILFGYKGSIYYEDMKDKNGERYEYPITEENALINSIKLKNMDEANYYIDVIINSFLENENVDTYTVEYTISTLLGNMVRELPFDKIHNKDYLKDSMSKKTLKEIRICLQQMCKEIIGYLNEYSNQENKYCKLAKEYLNDHYMKNISITDIADYLHISYPYLSKIFKENKNINILDYLNKIRIEHGKEYLVNTNKSISKIAMEVGYNNAQSFNRFFKKYEGITPGEYRKINHTEI